MTRLTRSLTRLGRLALPLALGVLLGATPQAQAGLPTMALQAHSAVSATIAAPALSEQLDAARVQLGETLELRDKQAAQPAWRYRQDLALDKQRLLDWLVDLQREKAKRIEELLALRNAATPPLDEDPLVKALRGTPPYSAIQVDALRDEIDGLKERLTAVDASFRANQTELQDLNDQLKSREAAARQAREGLIGKESEAEAAKAGEELEILDLLKRANEVEIATLSLEQERLKRQIASWRDRIEAMQAIVAKALPDQKLSLDDLAAQRQRVHSEQEKLASEAESMARRNAQHRADATKPDALLDLRLKTDNAILKGLGHLQMLNSLSGDAWEKRYALLSSADPEQRHSALQALTELQRKLGDLRSQSRTRQDALRTEIRAQRIRVDNLATDRKQGHEKEILDLLLSQSAMGERVEIATARLENQVSRWLADFADHADQGFHGRVLWLRDRALAVLKGVWQQELFVAEDVSEVDGRRVSVKYGVTVGKSVGLFVVFVVGYWLLSRISRFIQHQLVRSLKVSHQLASMIRRWSMIGLSFALIVLLLNLARIPLSVFAFLGGTLAIGVGFGAQTIIKNFISGLIMLFERKVRIGDVVELGGVTGHVTAVDLRATTVHGFNGVEALIPNANFIENQVINWTYSNQRIRRELHVDVAYGTDVRLAETLFLAAAAEHPCVLKDPAPEVFFDGIGDSALKIALIYWVEFENPMSPRRVDSDLRHGICTRLAEAGIQIPFPQRVVHVNVAQTTFPLPTHPEPPRAQ